jgi:DNA-binding SARP family transcriptional activator
MLLCILSLQSIYAEYITKGLYFYSYEENKENRTSLHVPVLQINSLYEGFSLDFEIKIRDEKQNFGYVFRMIGENNTYLDLVISDLRVLEKNNFISLISGNKPILTFKRNEVADFKFDAWNKVTISFSRDIVSMIVNGVKKEYTDDYDNIQKFDIYFGTNNNPVLFTTETPPMIVRNLRFFNKENRETRYWPLDKHGENRVYDEHKKEAAFVSNPKWELDHHLKWQKQKEFTFGPYPQIAFDNEQERIFFVSGNAMIIYHIQFNKLDTIRNIQGTAYRNRSNHMLYDSNNHKLISYNLLYDISGNRFTEFDFQSNQWDNTDNIEQKPFYWHHGKVFIPDSLLVTIGGYGFHKYKGVMLKYVFAEKKWKEINIAQSLFPRYLGSIGHWGDGKLLYFGGYGSESGYQEEHPKNYYDLYEIDLNTDSITKLWNMELPVNEEHFTNSNSMIIDKQDSAFYLLTYSNKLDNTNIQAKKFSLSSSKYTPVGDIIPYIFRDNKSYCDLYHAKQSNSLFAVTAHTEEDNTSLVSIYSIRYPPLNRADVFQTEQKSAVPFYWYFLALLLLPVLFFLRKKWNQREKKKQVVFSQDKIVIENINYEALPVEIQASSVNLLGGFCVIDDSGVDITGNFRPITIQIFLLCLLFSIKNGKGISSQELEDILWFDKDGEIARNNRNVSISKLRAILKNLKSFEINKDNGYWSVAFGKEVFCDYKNVLSLIKKIESEKITRKELLNKLLDLASIGMLLQDMQFAWMDTFKAEYTNTVIEKLTQISEREDVKEDFALLMKISNVILLHDSIDENALVKKCHVLYYSGKKGQAKQCFKRFVEDYKDILDTEYSLSFEEFRDTFIVK